MMPSLSLSIVQLDDDPRELPQQSLHQTVKRRCDGTSKNSTPPASNSECKYTPGAIEMGGR